MKAKPHLFSLSNNPDSLVAALIGFILIWVFSKHSGIGISPDSVTYLSAARHLAGGHGFLSFNNLPAVDFPIGYPFFLTIISFFSGLDPLQYGAILNGILFAILIYISGGIMNGFYKPSGWYKRILLACILLSPALQEVYSMLWSETLFLILILFFIFSISNYLNGLNLRWLLISTALCAFVCITRYAGFFLVITGCCLIFFNSKNTWRKRWIHSVIYGGLAIVPLMINVFRNVRLTGLATGPRELNHTGLFKILEYFGDVMSDWVALHKNTGLSILLALLVLLIFICTIILTYSKTEIKRYEYVASVTGLVYSLFMIATSTLARYEIFTNRLLAPSFIPLLWSISWWIPGFISIRSYRIKGLACAVFLCLSAWFLKIQLAVDYEYYDGVKDAGIPGYKEDEITRSAIVQYLINNKTVFNTSLPIYSNAGDAVYFFTGLPANQLPFIHFDTDVQHYYHQNPAYLIWFRDLDNPNMPPLNAILQNKKMELVQQLKDGAIYITQ